ncbi:cold shock domain-containing protein [Thiocystis violacea]|uniref:cold shock domain-containing protein n=1 Tax=Thiocystis violacea TaxID=13725 RepID=UPI001906E933|nr:cold shock domain-containing protein [Thiocystis violacea]MBK1716284.1 hypothetical protein [Thiocystis violacea]
MKGRISQWKEEKGFGFIRPDNDAEEIFFHISSVQTRDKRPRVGDAVLFDATRDERNRLKARRVVIESADSSPVSAGRLVSVQTAPRKNGPINYVLMLVLFGSMSGAAVVAIQSGDIEKTIPYGLPALLALILLSRPRKPKEKTFSCARCKTVAAHDKRTIRAWNNGHIRFYCGACHRQWLSENPTHAHTRASSSGGERNGCLGILALFALLPIGVGMLLSRWLI